MIEKEKKTRRIIFGQNFSIPAAVCEAGFNGLEKGQSLQTHEGHLLARTSLRRKNVFREKQLSINALYLRRILEVAVKKVCGLLVWPTKHILLPLYCKKKFQILFSSYTY